jgi:hypothetical protein
VKNRFINFDPRPHRSFGGLKLAELDPNDCLDIDNPLSEEDKTLIDTRFAAHDENPQSAISFPELQAQLQKCLGP